MHLLVLLGLQFPSNGRSYFQLLDLDPLSSALYVFINRKRDKLKILLWEKDGFVIWYKRLEKHKFHWPRVLDGDNVTLIGEQLNWLLNGYDVWRMKSHDALNYYSPA